ncbi:MAG: hypothetical protein ACFFF4_00615 [Candidatus Thorarchaeota archaeon]
MRKYSLVVIILILLSYPLPVNRIEQDQATATIRIDPFGAAAQYVDLLVDDTLAGNITADVAPVITYIFYDADYDYPLRFNPEDAVYSGYGMVDTFQYISDSDARMIMVAVNQNNLTQYIHISYQVLHPVYRNIRTWIETYPSFFVGFCIGGAVLVVFLMRLWLGKPESKESPRRNGAIVAMLLPLER